MADAPYLVALALAEFGGKRALPLTGRSLPPTDAASEDPGENGRGLALELLLRLWQRSDEGALQRAAASSSLLLLELPLETMTERLPLLKAQWIAGAETDDLLQGLQQLMIRGWRIELEKYQPLRFVPWP